MTRPSTHRATLSSPLGPIAIEASELGVVRVGFGAAKATSTATHPVYLRAAARQLEEYFAGTRQTFELQLDLSGPPFYRAVWTELLRVPFGDTVSYGDLARALKNPGSARAVGAANAKNRLPIIVPCHRVVGSDGRLTGYAYGLEKKRMLLDHEASLVRRAA